MSGLITIVVVVLLIFVFVPFNFLFFLNINGSIPHGWSSYPRTSTDVYSTTVVQEVINNNVKNNYNAYRMSFNPSVNPNQYAQYYFDHSFTQLVADLWHNYPPTYMSDVDWEGYENKVISFCIEFSGFQDRALIESPNECLDHDLGSKMQHVINEVRGLGYRFGFVINKFGSSQNWQDIADIADPLNKIYGGTHLYFSETTVDFAKQTITNGLECGLKIINTEVGADVDEHHEFSLFEVAELSEFSVWCAENNVGNFIWQRIGLENLPTYKNLGLINPYIGGIVK